MSTCLARVRVGDRARVGVRSATVSTCLVRVRVKVGVRVRVRVRARVGVRSATVSTVSPLTRRSRAATPLTRRA